MLIIRYLESKPNKNKITVYQQKKNVVQINISKIEHEQKYVVKKVTQKNSMKRRNNQQP